MPMVQIRHMLVRVGRFSVDMCVRELPPVPVFMVMFVMAIIVNVCMLVNSLFVNVLMAMVVVRQQYCAKHHEWCGSKEQPGGNFLKQHKGERNARQWRSAEKCAGARRPKPPQRMNEQDDAGAIT